MAPTSTSYSTRLLLPSPLSDPTSPNPQQLRPLPPALNLPPPALTLNLPPTPPRRTSAVNASKAITKQARSPSPAQPSKRRRKTTVPSTDSATSLASSSLPQAQPTPAPAPTRKRKDATKKKLARKTAHSLIERRRRGKMNEEFGRLRELVPGCRFGPGGKEEKGLEMHKLEVLQRTVRFMEYLKKRAGKGVVEVWEGTGAESQGKDDEVEISAVKDLQQSTEPSSSKSAPATFTGLQTPQMEPEQDPYYTHTGYDSSPRASFEGFAHSPPLPRVEDTQHISPSFRPLNEPTSEQHEALLLLSLTSSRSRERDRDRNRRISVHDLLSS